MAIESTIPEGMAEGERLILLDETELLHVAFNSHGERAFEATFDMMEEEIIIRTRGRTITIQFSGPSPFITMAG